MATSLVPGHVRSLPLGERIKWARKRAGFSHDRLNAAIGKRDRTYLIRVEKGAIKRPSRQLRDQIADATGVPRELFSNEDEEEPSLSMTLDEFLRSRVLKILREETRGARA